MTIRVLVSGLAAFWLAISGASLALAQTPSAMVEDISSDRDDVQLMDYLLPGQVIELSGGESLSISYFSSCVMETITGGTVTVGERKSAVTGGQIASDYVSCDDRVMILAEGQQQDAGTTAVRAEQPCGGMVPDIVVYDVSPMVHVTDPSDGADGIDYVACDSAASNTWQTLAMDRHRVDFRAAGIALERGRKYFFRQGDTSILVLISKTAGDNNPALISRLVPL